MYCKYPDILRNNSGHYFERDDASPTFILNIWWFSKCYPLKFLVSTVLFYCNINLLVK